MISQKLNIRFLIININKNYQYQNCYFTNYINFFEYLQKLFFFVVLWSHFSMRYLLEEAEGTAIMLG